MSKVYENKKQQQKTDSDLTNSSFSTEVVKMLRIGSQLFSNFKQNIESYHACIDQ